MPMPPAAQFALSRMISMDLFRAFCLFWMKSSAGLEKEKECSDSEENRVRSSPIILRPGVCGILDERWSSESDVAKGGSIIEVGLEEAWESAPELVTLGFG